MEFLLQQQWYDPRLRYSNRSKYEFLNAIHHYENIWLPDTYFIMHGDFKDPIIPVHFSLRIYRNGTVNYLMRYLATLIYFIYMQICVQIYQASDICKLNSRKMSNALKIKYYNRASFYKMMSKLTRERFFNFFAVDDEYI